MIKVVVDGPFEPYIHSAIARLSYLYPKAIFSHVPQGIEVKDCSGIPSETISREIHYALYREKIYAETMPMRLSLIEALTRR